MDTQIALLICVASGPLHIGILHGPDNSWAVELLAWQLRTWAQVIQSTKQKLPHVSDVVSRSHMALLIPDSIKYKWITTISLKERGTDPISQWKQYKRHVVREQYVGWKILLMPSISNDFERYNLLYCMLFFPKSLLFKKWYPIPTYKFCPSSLFLNISKNIKVSFALCSWIVVKTPSSFSKAMFARVSMGFTDST